MEEEEESRNYSFLGPDAIEMSAGEAILLLLTLEEKAAAAEDASMHTVRPTEKKGKEASHANESQQRMHFPDLTALYSEMNGVWY